MSERDDARDSVEEWWHPEDIDDEYRRDVRHRESWGAILTKLGISFKPNSTGQIFILCLFHREKTASLHFFPNGSYVCHGCHQGGDMAKFAFLHLQQASNGPVSRADLEVFFRGCVTVSDSQLSFPFP